MADLRYRYAFKPTGSTNCALVDYTDCVTTKLETNNYVGYMLTDFSKAFDMVNQTIVIRKSNLLDVPPLIKKIWFFPSLLSDFR